MNLSGSEREELQQAILDAYPDIVDLEMLVSFKFNVNLTAIAGGKNNTQIIFKLIQWAETKELIKELINALYQNHPQNEKIIKIYNQINRKFANPNHPEKTDENENESKNIHQLLTQQLEEAQNQNEQLTQQLKEAQNQNEQLIQQLEEAQNQNEQLIQQLNQEKYKLLKYFLQTKKWIKANEETLNIMNKISGRNTRDSWNERDVQQFPCDVLCQINQLWQQYSSNNCFGFTVQKSIWEERCTDLDNPEEAFGHYVGWYEEDRNQWLLLSDPAFKAKVSHQEIYIGILPTLTSNNSSMKVNAVLIPHLVAKLQSCDCNSLHSITMIDNT